MTTFKSKEQKEGEQVSQIDELRRIQKSGEAGTKPGNKMPEIEIPEHGADNYVWVQTTMKHLNTDQKSFNTINQLVPIHAGLFDRMVDQGGFATYDDVKIVHDVREDAREEYKFKTQQINPSSVENPSQVKESRTADMKAINEARTKIEQQKSTLESKAGELTTKENDLIVKESNITQAQADLDKRAGALKGLDDNLSQREQEIAKREQELAAREAALKEKK